MSENQMRRLIILKCFEDNASSVDGSSILPIPVEIPKI
ncbi:predicted protein [Botrytis cinerea T4]|uniref:Uncharacterized protein n=1 Tax=Botryotinia fuckeliana (strain T4) TaxID=999810 RepID=G2YAX0_BOTF4|nr:predicted protein [Botrytis cinerea T4]